MIVRIFQVRVHEGREADFADFFERTALPLVRSQPGIVSVTPGLPRPETPQEFCMVMVWRDLDSLVAFAGKDWQAAHVHPDEADLVAGRRVSHYDLLEV